MTHEVDELVNERISQEESEELGECVTVSIDCVGYKKEFSGSAILVVLKRNDGTYGMCGGVVNANVLADMYKAAIEEVVDSARQCGIAREVAACVLIDKIIDDIAEEPANGAE